MKKVLIGVGAVALITGAVFFTGTAISNAKPSDNKETCEPCPCTPDCQPGDDWCSCPEE
ncbi:MAG: hypothetical protein JJ975_08020 [Bacteroidia bacterium]|nr:hypothetical protein [Bacteroidia bacterium]